MDAAPRAIPLFSIIWMFAAIVVALLILANFSFGLLSAARAYVGGESLWSKAQKDAVFHLQRYAASRSVEELREFHEALAIPLGDYEAREEMNKPDPVRAARRETPLGGAYSASTATPVSPAAFTCSQLAP